MLGKVVSACLQPSVFKLTFSNLILDSQKRGESTGQLWKNRVVSINLCYAKARHKGLLSRSHLHEAQEVKGAKGPSDLRQNTLAS